MGALSSSLRRQLESAVLDARRASESASRAAVDGLGVFADRRPEHLNQQQTALRNGLRAKWRQLGGDRELLVTECAYEQWHRLLFTRFLAENHLLLHPEYRAAVTLEECEELAAGLDEPDGWSVAARFAAEILPGIFRLDDPCVLLRLAPEGRQVLEQIIAGIPAEVFTSDDALGWVYQFWQKDKKDEVNASERKVGGADLGPVTQLFTENYMVRFLLENSLGAWWATRHPSSALVKDFDYLRFDHEGKPAAGSFDGWPERVADVTVMDPCCGSGHFLVEAFSMLWRMRSEEEQLSSVEAQDLVLRENLFGLELDPRCVQIAMFAIALQAWKVNGKWRPLPVPNIGCSGLPVKSPVEDWKALAQGDTRIEDALARLHILFRDADTLGSLLDPRAAAETSTSASQVTLDDVPWSSVAPLVAKAVQSEADDPATRVLGADAVGVARATDLLLRQYVLVATNVPFLIRRSQTERLRNFVEARGFAGTHDLATVMFERCVQLVRPRGSVACVSPQNWLYLKSFEPFRRRVLSQWSLRMAARLGEGGFWSNAAAGAFTCLTITNRCADEPTISFIDASAARRPDEKARVLISSELTEADTRTLKVGPAWVIAPGAPATGLRISDIGQCLQGISTGDGPRFVRRFWEVADIDSGWARMQGSVTGHVDYGGRSNVVWWEGGSGELRDWHDRTDARIRGTQAWGRRGVAVSQMREVPCTLYEGDLFDNNSAVIVPESPSDIAALWAFTTSQDFRTELRRLTPKISVEVATIESVPMDVEYWRQKAEEAGPLPEPWTDDPTQWLFGGRPEAAKAPLQVAVGRLLGYRWPGQPLSDDLDPFADRDGVVCLPSVAGEGPAADRLQQVLGAAFGDQWSASKARELLERAGSKKKSLDEWLRDEFFKQHCALFANRPYVWHIWDGQRDGFAALVNCHRLDSRTLEKLTYTYLGQDWVERQRAGVRDETPGADSRLAAALELQRKLEGILDGEKPYDIYVRWKDLHEQPVGWEPDINDGVRVNIRPFVEAGILRAPFNIHWKKDRGKNPDGSDRHNNIHLSLAEKLESRKGARVS